MMNLLSWLVFAISLTPWPIAHAGNMMYMPRAQAPASVPVYCPTASAFPIVRVLSNSYWTNYSGPLYTNMTSWVNNLKRWEAPTNGVQNGELLIAIAVTDNGSATTWTSSGGLNKYGFTQLSQQTWGNDGQTYQVAYKVAYNEPVRYAGQLNNTISGSKVVLLLAVDCYNAVTPVVTAKSEFAVSSGTSTTTATAPLAALSGLTTNSLLIYFAMGDWENLTASVVSYALPGGFTDLGLYADQGPAAIPQSSALTADWTTVNVGSMVVGSTSAGPFNGNEQCASGNLGLGAAGLITILAP